MTYTIKDEIHEILAETMCELAADASLSYVLNEVLDMDLGGPMLSPQSHQVPVQHLLPSTVHPWTYGWEWNRAIGVLQRDTSVALRARGGRSARTGSSRYNRRWGLSSCGEAELEPEAILRAEYLDKSAIRRTARSILCGRDGLFATREETFHLNETPLGNDLAKAEALSEAEGEYYRDHMVEANIAQQTHDRSFWGAFLAAAGNAWHEPMHQLRARGRQRLRFVYLYEGDSPLDNPRGPPREKCSFAGAERTASTPRVSAERGAEG